MQEHWFCSLSQLELKLHKLKKLDLVEPALTMTVVSAAEQLGRVLKIDRPEYGQFVVVRLSDERRRKLSRSS